MAIANATTARAEAQKAYKKAKKKRRIQRKAEAKRNESSSSTTAEEKERLTKAAPDTKWYRIGKEDGCKKAVDRPVDDAMVNKLLEKRSKCKLEKNYVESDKITLTLVDMEIVYDDALKQWHTRLLSTVARKAKMAREAYNDNL